MSLQKGLTSWIVKAGSVNVAYRWNMRSGEAIHTFRVCYGRRHLLLCGPLIVEW